MYSVDESLLNTWGGSVSIGHPFGATGVRLLSHAANRHAPDTTADTVNTMAASICLLLTDFYSEQHNTRSDRKGFLVAKTEYCTQKESQSHGLLKVLKH